MSTPRPRGTGRWPTTLVWTVACGIGGAAVGVAIAVAPAERATPVEATSEASQDGHSAAPSPTPSPDVLDGYELDELQETHVEELRAFIGWLEDNEATGYVGEVGWPRDGDPAWTTLGEAWYTLADSAGLWTSAWAAGSAWPDQYPLVTYGDSGSGSLDTGSAQGEVIEALASDGGARHGVNLAGLEFGTGGAFSNETPGELGVDYFAEPVASYAWLAQRGIDLVRLPVRWERLQPALDGELDAGQVEIVTAQLDAAAAAGIEVILDLHNYGAYVTPHGAALLGSEWLTEDQFVDVWLRLADAWGDHPAVVGYGLMNEPHDIGGDSATAAATWESVSQAAVDALRAAGDERLILVAGYDWSSLARWAGTHPTGWIDDPADAFRYEAHHYWDQHGAGEYSQSYADELAALTAS
ncbi:glycoside hydrolase family 5 protein [Demequina sp. NBRC 110056]|uniref:glycoside hydrolase family 5 protein n=1 Tax=Demequina sp. NBRC 110056 TaxID=1570345 RepID=UPI0011812E28|nr:cellulase family glycosylhydrolase [Demequina sp. NBRC 110056]